MFPVVVTDIMNISGHILPSYFWTSPVPFPPPSPLYFFFLFLLFPLFLLIFFSSFVYCLLLIPYDYIFSAFIVFNILEEICAVF